MEIKKEILLITFILIFVIGLEFFTAKYTTKTVDMILLDANAVIEELKEQKVPESIHQLKKDWFDYEKRLSCYIEHNELEKVTSSMILLEENAKNHEYNQALANSKEFIFWLEHFKEKDELIWKNIL